MNIGSASTTYENSFFIRKAMYEQFSTKKTDEQISTKHKISEDTNEEEKKNIEKLEARDKEVKEHEQAHMSAAGSLASTPKYKTKAGPDGKQYAVSGSVNIDTSKGKTPEETIAKSKIIRQAALAPKNPSSQDQKVAQKAAQMEAAALAELAKKKQEGMKEYYLSEKINNSKNVSVAGKANISSKEMKINFEENGSENSNINVSDEELSSNKIHLNQHIDFFA